MVDTKHFVFDDVMSMWLLCAVQALERVEDILDLQSCLGGVHQCLDVIDSCWPCINTPPASDTRC